MTNRQKIMMGLGLLYIGYGTAVQGNMDASIYYGIVSIILGIMTLINKRHLALNVIKIVVMSLIQIVILYASTLSRSLPSLYVLAIANSFMAQSILVSDRHGKHLKLIEGLTVVFMVFIILAITLPLDVVNGVYDVHLVSSSMSLVTLISCIFLPHLMPYLCKLLFIDRQVKLQTMQTR